MECLWCGFEFQWRAFAMQAWLGLQVDAPCGCLLRLLFGLPASPRGALMWDRACLLSLGCGISTRVWEPSTGASRKQQP